MREISAGGIVFRQKKGQYQLLLIKDRFGKITFPKGKKEGGETPEENALREIREETAMEGRIVAPLTKIFYEYDHNEKGKVEKEVTYFLVEAVSGKESPQLEEIDGVDWYSIPEAKRLQKEAGYDNNDIVMQKAVQYLKEDL